MLGHRCWGCGTSIISSESKNTIFIFSLLHLNYGGVYVGLPSDATAMVSSQTKAAPKGI
uniref:Uncharacterized protein n=1 Tax=Dromaius novaehollandiae TaxID=8790 RepID=A0A8C4JJC1_DRONO